MLELITDKPPKPLVDAYMNSVVFHAVATKHEILRSSYTEMLEDAVAHLVAENAKKDELLQRLAAKFGVY